MSAIQKKVQFDKVSQEIVFVLTNEFGEVVHYGREPLVKPISDERGNVAGWQPNNPDAVIDYWVRLHEERHALIVKQAKERGHL